MAAPERFDTPREPVRERVVVTPGPTTPATTTDRDRVIVDQHRDRDNGSFWAWAIGIIVVLALIALAIWWWASPNADRDAAYTLSDIGENPTAYIGKTVTVNGEIEKVRGTNLFVMEEDGFMQGDEAVIVTRRPLAQMFVNHVGEDGVLNEGLEDRNVRVTGEVRAFDRVEVERELGYALDDQYAADFEGRPVIIADSVSLIED